MNSCIQVLTEFGNLILACMDILCFNQNFKVEFVRRQANENAHTLARVAPTNACTHVFSPLLISSLKINFLKNPITATPKLIRVQLKSGHSQIVQLLGMDHSSSSL